MDLRRRCSFSPVSSPPSESETGAVCRGPTREQERFLPVANVSRIMKKSLPGNAKISKEAKETVQECVSEFISFITSEASDKCQREKRKTINGDDLLWAMKTLGFEDYVGPLKIYLDKYRETEGEKTSMVRQGGDQSPKEESNFRTTNHDGNPTASNRDLSGFHGGFYSEISTSLGVGGRVLGYGEKLKMNDFHAGKTDGNVVRNRASHHLGIKW